MNKSEVEMTGSILIHINLVLNIELIDTILTPMTEYETIVKFNPRAEYFASSEGEIHI